MKLSFPVLAILLAVAAPYSAAAEEYDQYVKTDCVASLNTFSANFFYSNHSDQQYVQGSNTDRGDLHSDKANALFTSLEMQNIYIIPQNAPSKEVGCELPSLKGGKPLKIKLKAFHNPQHETCSRGSFSNIDYQLRVDEKLIAEDTMDFNCAYLHNATSTGMYALSVIAGPHSTLEICNYFKSGRVCKQYSLEDASLVTPIGLARERAPKLKGWQSEK